MSVVFVDRESAYPNRYRVIPDSGNAYTVILERDDEPIAPGTPLNAETFNALVDEIDKKAPGGYGLGEISYKSGNPTRFTDASKLDDMKVNSFWAYQKSNSPLIPDQADTQFLYGYTVASGAPYVTQRAVTLYGGSWIERTLGLRNSNGAWSDWKYVNPPMALGKTYLTTEFFLSKPVYKQVVNLGEFPAGGGFYGVGGDDGMTSNPSMGGGTSGGSTGDGSTAKIVSCNLVDFSGTTFTVNRFAFNNYEFATPASFPGGTIYAVVAYTLS